MLPNVHSTAPERPDACDRPPGKKAENAATDAFQLLLALWSPLPGAPVPPRGGAAPGGGPLPAGGKGLPAAATDLTTTAGPYRVGTAVSGTGIGAATGRPVATAGAAPLPVLAASTLELATRPDGVRGEQGTGGAAVGTPLPGGPVLRPAGPVALPATTTLPQVPAPAPAAASLATAGQPPGSPGAPAPALPALAPETVSALTQHAPAVSPGSPPGLPGSPPVLPAGIPGTPPPPGRPPAIAGERPGSAGEALPPAAAPARATTAPAGAAPPIEPVLRTQLREAADAAGRQDIPAGTGTGPSGTALAAPLPAAAAPAPAAAPPAPAGSAPAAVPVLPPIDVPPGSAGWSDALGGRVTVMARHDLQQAEIHLHPAELGPLRVHVSVDDGKASLHFHAQHALTRDAIEQALPRLRDMLGEQGLSLGQASVSGHGTGHEQAAPERGPGGRSASPIRGVASAGSVDTAPPIAARRAPPGRLDLFA